MLNELCPKETENGELGAEPSLPIPARMVFVMLGGSIDKLTSVLLTWRGGGSGGCRDQRAGS